MTIKLEIAGAARDFADSGNPVLCFDACAILDIIRTPILDSLHNNILDASMRIVQASQDGNNSLHTVVSELIPREVDDNKKDELVKVVKHLTGLERQHLSVSSALSIVEPTFLVKRLDYKASAVAKKLEEIVEKILFNSVEIEDDRNCIIGASSRTILGLPPSRKGKQEHKDCIIIEHYMELCRQIHEINPSCKVLFVSSNTKDYCENGELRRELAIEFNAINLKYCQTLDHAAELIGI